MRVLGSWDASSQRLEVGNGFWIDDYSRHTWASIVPASALAGTIPTQAIIFRAFSAYRLGFGNAEDVRPVGEGISELRIDYGPGYRIYFQKRGTSILILLSGGDKSIQAKDIKVAKRLAKEWSEEDG
jgi:putative addiction module killer protein